MAVRHLLRSICQNYGTALVNNRRRHFYSLNDNLLRILNNELTYLVDYKPPLQPPKHFRSYTIQDTPGTQWVRLRKYDPYRNEEVKIDATMFDGIAPIPERLKRVYEGEVRLHSSFIVEVSKGDDESEDDVVVFVCSAWPESIEVQKVFPVQKGSAKVHPYMGRNFKDLSKEVQKAILDYLKEREIDDELAEFIHEYMANKDKAELLRWMKTVESYVQK